MSRLPLAYPLHRASEMDGGGAADLQTDIMRFMAILSLCLVAIFALVQSIPLAPPTTPSQGEEQQPPLQQRAPANEVLPATKDSVAAREVTTVGEPAPREPAIVLTRPRWNPKTGVSSTESSPAPAAASQPPIPDTTDTPAGFTLRFESDAALLRAVAAGKVGVYAITAGRSRRMSVSDSRISFWDASTPNSFHEMEAGTVPVAVITALGKTEPAAVSRWGVTMPGRMTAELEALMSSNTGGMLVIAADGRIRLENP